MIFLKKRKDALSLYSDDELQRLTLVFAVGDCKLEEKLKILFYYYLYYIFKFLFCVCLRNRKHLVGFSSLHHGVLGIESRLPGLIASTC